MIDFEWHFVSWSRPLPHISSLCSFSRKVNTKFHGNGRWNEFINCWYIACEMPENIYIRKYSSTWCRTHNGNARRVWMIFLWVLFNAFVSFIVSFCFVSYLGLLSTEIGILLQVDMINNAKYFGLVQIKLCDSTFSTTTNVEIFVSPIIPVSMFLCVCSWANVKCVANMNKTRDLCTSWMRQFQWNHSSFVRSL